MAELDVEKLQEVAAKLRKRADFFLENDPESLSKDDFSVISSYLNGLADTLEGMGGARKKVLWRNVTAVVLYLLAFVGSCWLFYHFSPYEGKYYAKLAKEVAGTEQEVTAYATVIQAGIGVFCGLFVFFVSVFVSIILCGFVRLFTRRIDILVEAAVTLLLAGGSFLAYYQYVLKTGLLNGLL